MKSLLIGFSLLLIGAIISPDAKAQQGYPLHAPEFPGRLIWLNSSPQAIQNLKGKVVLIDFWDYTCVNCIRTLPYLKEWNRRYAKDGLVIIGVHTPEFAFAKKKENVEKAILDSGITYPVVLDNDYQIWRAYVNQYWPRKYLIDHQGQIIYDHIGEGGYQETEKKIQETLKAANPSVRQPQLFTIEGDVETGGVCYPVTAELYLGYQRGLIGNKEGFNPGKTVDYSPANPSRDGYFYLSGKWLNLGESLRYSGLNTGFKDTLSLKYHALGVNLVAATAISKPVKVFVLLNGKPVPRIYQGKDIQSDSKGNSYFQISASRMYRLIQKQPYGTYTLQLIPESGGVELFAFTFESCGKPDTSFWPSHK